MAYSNNSFLPLVQLKEKRRDLIRALQGSSVIPNGLITEIAAVQQVIKAIEELANDMEPELFLTATNDQVVICNA